MTECHRRRATQLETLRAVYAASGCPSPPPLRVPLGLDESFAASVDQCNAVLYTTSHADDGTGFPDVCCRLQGDEYAAHSSPLVVFPKADPAPLPSDSQLTSRAHSPSD